MQVVGTDGEDEGRTWLTAVGATIQWGGWVVVRRDEPTRQMRRDGTSQSDQVRIYFDPRADSAGVLRFDQEITGRS